MDKGLMTPQHSEAIIGNRNPYAPESWYWTGEINSEKIYYVVNRSGGTIGDHCIPTRYESYQLTSEQRISLHRGPKMKTYPSKYAGRQPVCRCMVLIFSIA
ncbi:MAG: hypothetical protein ACETWG_11445, partial [Candidatus Neomarinimicrobiota bacterium]